MSQWQEKQLAVSKNLVQQGSQALRQGDFNTANAALAEANVILDMAEEETLDVLQLRAQALNESGFILQRANQPQLALRNHKRASEICEKIIEQGVEFRGNAAATNINLAGLLASGGDFEAAKAANLRALELAESLVSDGKDVGQGRDLAFGANSNFAIIAARAEDWDAASDAMARALALIDEMGANARENISAQGAQACQQLSVLNFHAERFDDALRWGREAETLSERAHDKLGEAALPIYVTSQINLISYNEKAGNYADAEDCLFKALDVVGNHPQILLRGKAFYDEARKQADNRLEKGGLPREEVEDSLSEIEDRIEAMGGLDKVLEMVQDAERAAQQQQRPPQQRG